MVFHPSAGSPAEAISLIRAKELAQAAVAETAARLELDAAARRVAEAAAEEVLTPGQSQGEGSPLCDSRSAGTGLGNPSGGAQQGAVAQGLSPPAGPSRGRSGRTASGCKTRAARKRAERPLSSVRKGLRKRKGAQ